MRKAKDMQYNEGTLTLALPIEVQTLLEKYKDLVSDGTPATLPPRRVISHQIDFVLGDSLPNNVQYKLTLDHNLEVARQVQELMDQGLIQMSIRPCVVPMVLASKKREKWICALIQRLSTKLNQIQVFRTYN